MILYRVLLTLIGPVLAGLFLLRVLRGHERWRDLRERLGLVPKTDVALWVHGASNGELGSAKPVLLALRDRHPDLHLLVTANTLTGRDLVAGWKLGRVTARLAPLDTRWARPRAAAHITLEAELWPNRIRALPTCVLGARLSERTARSWRKLPGLSRAVFPHLASVIPQDAQSAARFEALGVAKSRLSDPVQLKALYAPPDRAVPSDIAAAFPRASTWLAASTHEGEDEVVISAHQILVRRHPDLRLILAPRHPARGDAIADLLNARQVPHHRRSLGPVPPETAVLLADTMGEMDHWYRSAAITFIGGTLGRRGGHTPFEPAAFDSALIHGPDVRNFAETFAALGQDGARQITDAASLATAVAALLDPNIRDAQTARACACLANADPLAGILEQLDDALHLSRLGITR